MQYFIYLTTNLINGKKYIGKHYGEFDDSYLGSGILLERAILKYGKENFSREILHVSNSAEENNAKEKEFILRFDAVKSEEFYNIAPGGDGGDIFHSLTPDRQQEVREKARKQCTGEGNPMFGKKHSDETKEKLRQVDKSYTQTENYRAKMSLAVLGEKNGMFGKKHSDETIEKMRQAAQSRDYLGNKNPNAKSISAYEDAEFTKFVKNFPSKQDALFFLGNSNLSDYSGLNKRMKDNKPYKGYYWKIECRD